MIKLKKLEAGAIQYVLVISVVIMIVLFAFISLIFLQKKFQNKSVLYQEAVHSNYAAFDYLAQANIPYNNVISKQFSELNGELTEITKKRWGLFDLVGVETKIGNERSMKFALMGNHDKDRKALYLKDNNQPLKVVGNTKIVGDVVLPTRGVSSGNMGGRSYYGNKLIYGNITQSSSNLPNINNLDYIKQLIIELPLENVKQVNPQQGVRLDQSFNKETLLFFSLVRIDVDNLDLSGNIIVKSDTEIRVSASAYLEDVILIAPKISIESDFKGSIQAFATEQIIVSNNVKLMYPSALVVVRSKYKDVDSNVAIQLKDGTDVRGIVFYHEQEQSVNYNVHVQIDPTAQVVGEVYCNKNLELKGKVCGFVYAHSFIAKEFGGTFVNHVYNGEINSNEIPKQYSGLFLGNRKTTVAKWVD